MSMPSPFADSLRSRGATFARYGALELPERVSTTTEEYAHARASAALFDFSFRAGLRFVGADRQTFLHNLLSNDILALKPGAGCYTTLLTQQSKVVCDAYAFCLADCIRLDVDAAFQGRAREHLEKFLIADEVEIEDPAASEAILGILGPRSSEVLRAAGAEAPGGELEHRDVRIGGGPGWVARIDCSGDPGFELVVPRAGAEAAWQALLAAGEPLGLVPAGMSAFDVLRLEAGIPWPGVDFDETCLVLEAGLERGINFRKGCYLGQEVVERASARGHVNRRLVGLHIDGDAVPERRARLCHQDRDCGHVTSAAWSPRVGAALALGYVRREFQAAGTSLQVEVAGALRPAQVVTLPFYRRN